MSIKKEQRQWTAAQQWNPERASICASAQLVLIFGERKRMADGKLLREIQTAYPRAHLFGCSTAGEILGTNVYDDSVTTTAIHFERTPVKAARLRAAPGADSFEVGKRLAESIDHKNLTHVLALSIGLNVNGSALVKGLTAGLPAGVGVTGGLAGDQDRFQETLVVSDGEIGNDLIAIVGLYGGAIQVGSASLGGWDSFGPERLVTKSKGNVLYELDGKSALETYKTYLGDFAKDLPGSALLFPLSLRTSESEKGIVRTCLAVNEADQSMTFAGDIPENSYARLMKANFDRLIEGAVGAAKNSRRSTAVVAPDLALLISCVGRKIVLKQRVEEEVEGVREIFGAGTALTGFYSYGEISPFTPDAKCELHNQTMTITTLRESEDDAA